MKTDLSGRVQYETFKRVCHCSLNHILRTFRETGYQTTCSIIKVCCKTAESEDVENPIKKFAFLFANQLSIGLADNWSQVRMAAVSKLILFISFRNWFCNLFFCIFSRQLLDNFLFAWKDQIKTVKSTLYCCQDFAWIDTISLKASEYIHKM